MKKRLVILDFSYFLHANLHVAWSKDKLDMSFNNWKFMMVNSLFRYIRQFPNSDFVIALDSKGSWRKEAYPEYKSSRGKSQDANGIPFDIFFKEVNDFIKDLKDKFFRLIFIAQPNTEGDDVFGILVKEKASEYSEIIGITVDKDMFQLQKYHAYKQYSPSKKMFIENQDPIVYLKTMFIIGDSGDDVPQLKKGVGPVAARKIITEGLDAWFDTHDEEEAESLRKAYERNKMLIDLEMIPPHIWKPVLDDFDEQLKIRNNDPKRTENSSIYKLFTKIKSPSLMMKYSEIEQSYKTLCQ